MKNYNFWTFETSDVHKLSTHIPTSCYPEHIPSIGYSINYFNPPRKEDTRFHLKLACLCKLFLCLGLWMRKHILKQHYHDRLMIAQHFCTSPLSSFVIWSSKMSRNSQIVIFRWSQLKGKISYVLFCFEKPSPACISGTNQFSWCFFCFFFVLFVCLFAKCGIA